MGRLTKPLQAGFGDASKFMDNFMARKFGFSSHQYNIVDGSGLSTYNYITPSFMIDLLKLMYDNENLFPHFYNSLPISGMDGTLKTRLNTKSTINRVRAKTGSLTGSCTLAG
jgi:D-alanyl-D-alanine carboxypeptidase/D-alanyl-D-alanine-endopeptidase (penicillin-binding protein 4)